MKRTQHDTPLYFSSLYFPYKNNLAQEIFLFLRSFLTILYIFSNVHFHHCCDTSYELLLTSNTSKFGTTRHMNSKSFPVTLTWNFDKKHLTENLKPSTLHTLHRDDWNYRQLSNFNETILHRSFRAWPVTLL